MIRLEESIIRKLKTTQSGICTVESCTGGLMAHLLTNVAGASEVYWGSYVVYDNSAKEAIGVPVCLLKNHGAVSSAVARKLAECGLVLLQKTLQTKKFSFLTAAQKTQKLICISSTGIAGPGGGTPEKPVGLCFLGLAQVGVETQTREIRLSIPLDREKMKFAFVQEAFQWIRASL